MIKNLDPVVAVDVLNAEGAPLASDLPQSRRLFKVKTQVKAGAVMICRDPKPRH